MFSAKTNKGAAPVMPRSNGKAGMPSIISHNLSVLGDLSSDGDIQIDGAVEGDVKSVSLTIGETGLVKGTIDAETVQMSGTVVGQIRAKTVSLTRSARVEGDIAHDSISIEAGAQFVGQSRRFTPAVEKSEQDTATWAMVKPHKNAGAKAQIPEPQGEAD